MRGIRDERLLLAQSGIDVGGEVLQVAHGLDGMPRQTLDEVVENVDGRRRIIQRAVVRRHLGADVAGEVAEAETARPLPVQQPARELQGVDDRGRRPGDAQLPAGCPEESDVERGVVRHPHRARREFQEAGEHGAQLRGTVEVGVGDPRQLGDEAGQPHSRIDQGAEPSLFDAAADAHGADFDDVVLARAHSGGFEVDDHERGLAQSEFVGARPRSIPGITAIALRRPGAEAGNGVGQGKLQRVIGGHPTDSRVPPGSAGPRLPSPVADVKAEPRTGLESQNVTRFT